MRSLVWRRDKARSNDLAVEGSSKLVELTIKAKEKEWSFSCGEGDYSGHESDSDASRKPHYHFQMRENGQPYIDYNNFHLPLSANDMRMIEAKRTGAATAKYAGGEGLSEIFTDENMEHLATMGTPVEAEGEGLAKLDQFVVARPLAAYEARISWRRSRRPRPRIVQ